MAEELIIRVKIDGKDTQHSGQGRDLTKSNVGRGVVASGSQDKMKTILKNDRATMRQESSQEQMESPSEIMRNKEPSMLKNESSDLIGIGISLVVSSTARQIAKSITDQAMYKFGDAYVGEQVQNFMQVSVSAGTILTSLALKLDPKIAALHLIGMVSNEAVKQMTSVMKYNNKRQEEQNKAMNISILAGDISYGRRNGGV